MDNSLIQDEIFGQPSTGTVNRKAHWLKVNATVSYSGISRAVLYGILAGGSAVQVSARALP
jgi:hypothetical protein